MPKYTLDLSGLGGLAPRFEGDLRHSSAHPELRTLGKENQYARGTVNPMRMLGYMSPGNNSLVSVTTDGSGIVAASEIDTGLSHIHFFERGTDLLEATSFGATAIGSDRTITGATGTDLQVYTVNGVRQLFYSYQKSGGGNIGIHDFASTFDDDWLSAAASGGFNTGATNEVQMRVADNGFMYVLDGSSLHKIDGTTAGGANGTATANVLLFPATMQLVDAIDSRGYFWILVIQSTVNQFTGTGAVPAYGGVYIWDRQSTVVNTRDFVPIEGITMVKKIFTYEGTPHCFTMSTSQRTQLRRYNGSIFEVQYELGTAAYPPFPDSVTALQNGILWIGVDGKFYFYGRPYPKAEIGLFILGDLTKTQTGWSQGFTGCLATVYKSISSTTGESTNVELIYVNYRDTSTDEAGIWYPFSSTADGNTAIQASGGEFRSLNVQLPKLSTINEVTLYYPPVSGLSGTTGILDVNFYLNKSTTPWGTTTIQRADASRGYKYIPMGESNVNSFQLSLYWKTSGNPIKDSITPSHAEIDYTPKTKKL